MAFQRIATPEEKKCIYCTKTKKKSEFNAEHVIPQSYGKFEQNLTLHCVCKKCNTQFGKDLDEPLACDSIEAVDRIRYGIKDASSFRSLGKRSTLHRRVTEPGPLNGAYLFLEAGPNGNELRHKYPRQVGFALSPEGPFEWFLIDELPPKAEIIAKGYLGNGFMRFQGFGSAEDAKAAVEAAGYAPSSGAMFRHTEEQCLAAETVGFVGDGHCRAMAKIAFNYFAFVFGPATALMSQFNVVRSYIVDGVQPPERIVTLHPSNHVVDRNSDGAQVNGHYIAVRRDGPRIVAELSLFLRLRYTVVLSAEDFLTTFDPSSAHFFDLESREIGPIDQPRPFD